MSTDSTDETPVLTPDGPGFPEGTHAVVQKTVADGSLPALMVVHDGDGDWLLCDGVNDANEDGSCVLCTIASVTALDPTLHATAALPPGWAAYRDAADEMWIVEPFAYADEDEDPDEDQDFEDE